MITETPPRVSLCFNQIQLYVPRSLADINRARKLLDMLEAELSEEKSEIVPVETKPQECPQNIPQDERQGQPMESPPDKAYDVSIPTQKGLAASQIEAMPISPGDQGELGNLTSKIEENGLNRKFDASVKFFIPKFSWDKTKEKLYRTIFFFEHEDGSRVMIFYLNSRVFTTKEAVMNLPYPVPFSYAPLRSIQNNKRTALKFYREYLAKEARSQEVDSAIRKDEQDKGVYDDIQLNGNEDEDLIEDAKEAEDKRLEKLKKTADVNKKRWEERVETEISPRTKELRDKFGLGVIIQGKE